MAPGEDRWDVFLAHAGPDAARAKILYDALVALDLKVFLDVESLAPGDDWHARLPELVRTSDVVVVLVSGHTDAAHYEGEEVVIAIEEARKGGARVVPVHLAPDLTAPYGTARLNRIDWHVEAEVDAVVTRLRRVIPRAVHGQTTGASIFCHRIPVPPRHFAGRDDLLGRLDANLAGGRTTTLTQTIHGMGGVGKTTVAAALCEDQRDQRDIIWWVRAEEQATLAADLAELAAEVGATTGRGGDADAQQMIQWLETTDRRWLVVFDNVIDRDAIHPWLPRRGPGAAVITSRYRHMDELGPVEPVDLLPTATAETFLRRRVPSAADEDLGPVLERVGGLPLALEQAAAWVGRKPNRTFGQWVELYERAADRAFPDGTRPIGYEHTAATAWRVSIAAATVDAPSAERLLGALGFFAPEGIAIQWLRDAAHDAYLGVTSTEVDAAIDALDDYDLVTITADDTVDIHRIIHDVARRSAPPEAGPFAVGAISAQDPRTFEHRDWPLLSALAPHARHAAEVLDLDEVDDGSSLVLLLTRVAKVASFGGRTREALLTARSAVEAAQVAAPGTITSLLASDALATAYEYGGRLDLAIPVYESTLEESERLLGTDETRMLMFRANLANAYRMSGDAERAIPVQEAVLAESERIYGPHDAVTLTNRNNLASSYATAGRLDRAIQLFSEVLEERKRVLRPDHEHTLASQHNLAGALARNGDLDRAIEVYEPTLAARERTLGGDHADTLNTRSNLANALLMKREIGRATALYESVVVDRRRLLGRDHPDTLISCHNLAQCYFYTPGAMPRATALMTETLESLERTRGPQDRLTRSVRENLELARQELARREQEPD